MTTERAGPRGRARRSRSLGARLLLSFGTLVVLLLAGEIGVRVAGLGPPRNRLQYLAHPDLVYVHAPGQERTLGRDDPDTGERPYQVTIDARGQRGTGDPREARPGERRIVLLGDSLVFGPGVDDDETLPARLQAVLAEQHPAQGPVRVINAGVNGYTTLHYMRWMESQLDAWRPDLVVVGCYIGNDNEIPPEGRISVPVPLENLLRYSALGYALKTAYRDRAWKERRKLKGLAEGELDPQIAAYRGLIQSQLSLEDQRTLWEHSLDHLRRVRDVAREHGTPVAVVLIPTWPDIQAEEEPAVHAWLAQRIEALGLPLILLRDDLHAVKDDCRLAWDRGHFNPRGHDVAARVLARELGELGLLPGPD